MYQLSYLLPTPTMLEIKDVVFAADERLITITIALIQTTIAYPLYDHTASRIHVRPGSTMVSASKR